MAKPGASTAVISEVTSELSNAEIRKFIRESFGSIDAFIISNVDENGERTARVRFADAKALLQLLKHARDQGSRVQLPDGTTAALVVHAGDTEANAVDFSTLSGSDGEDGEEDEDNTADRTEKDAPSSEAQQGARGSASPERSPTRSRSSTRASDFSDDDFSDDEDDESDYDEGDEDSPRQRRRREGGNNAVYGPITEEEALDRAEGRTTAHPAAAASQEKEPKENRVCVFTFAPLTDDTTRLAPVTPLMLHQVLRGNCFPKKMIICKPRGSDKEGEDENAPQLKYPHHADPRRSVRVLVEFGSAQLMRDAVDMFCGVKLKLLAGKKGDDTGAAVYMVYVKESQATTEMIHVSENTDRTFGVTPACVHLVGPAFEREWTSVEGRHAERARQAAEAQAAAPPLTLPADMPQIAIAGRVLAAPKQHEAPPPLQPQQHAQNPLPSNVQQQQSLPAAQQPQATHSPHHGYGDPQQQQQQQQQQPSPAHQPLRAPAAPTYEQTAPVQQQHQPHQAHQPQQQATAAPQLKPTQPPPPPGPPGLPPNWKEYFDQRYQCPYYVRTDPATGAQTTVWERPTQ